MPPSARPLLAFTLAAALVAPLLASAAARPRIGLVLGSGGIGGLAHIGVSKWLYAHRIPVDAIAGASMGALVGGIYSTGRIPAELAQIAESVDLRELFATRTDFEELNVHRRRERLEIPGAIKVGLHCGIHIESSRAVFGI